MQSLLNIRVQKLFLLTIILKVGSSFLGWLLRDPWILGFSLPLSFMAAYIAMGLKRRDNDVSDESFADSCYYLGFIFTITSIIFSLLDLPNIGTRINDIAVRFGAAMVSTVFGLVVRVYLVSFKKDVSEAVREVQDTVIDSARRFSEQLVMSYDKLRAFESTVDKATKEAVERVNTQVESLSKNHADRLADFFVDLSAKNQEAFAQALNEVRAASLRLSESVDGYSNGMRANLTSIESKVSAFAEAIAGRLATTTFPDDYFAKHLAGPLAQLSESTQTIAGSITAASEEVAATSETLSSAMKTLRSKAKATDDGLEKVLHLTTQQQAVLESAQGQLDVLGQLANSLSGLDTALSKTLGLISSSNETAVELTTRVSAVVSESAETRQVLTLSLDAIAHKLSAGVSATEAVASKIDTAVAADQQTSAAMEALNSSASKAIGKFDVLTSQLQTLVSQLSNLDASLLTQQELKVATGSQSMLFSPDNSAHQSNPTASPSGFGAEVVASNPHAQTLSVSSPNNKV